MVAPLESSVVRIYSKTGKVVGAGFLVSSTHVLTCAHVVTDALGISRTTQEQPDGIINLDFPLLAAKQMLAAKVIFWEPYNPNKVFEDIAGLELEASLPDTAQPAQLVTSEDLWGHHYRVFGFPAGQPNGVSSTGVLRGRTAKGWVQLEDVKQQGYPLEPGFSGAPVWDEEHQGVAGMAVSVDPNRPEIKAAFIIPTSLLISAWSELGEQAISSCPYRGLFAFREQDTKFFFGRETFTQQLVAAVQRQRLVAVIGPSGSGKSSVVFAGLIPQLRTEQGWLIEAFRPGDHPFQKLASSLVPWFETYTSETDQLRAINKLAKAFQQKELAVRDVVARILEKNSGNRLLLIADQFEELYSLCSNDLERQELLEQLLEAVHQTKNFTLVLTLRADFLGYALSYRPLADALQSADVKLGPMNRVELRDAIEKPAALLGVQIESGLTERILNAVEEKPGHLPLLEFALSLLWTKQQNSQLTHRGYEQIGGVEMALADYAEKEYRQLREVEQQRTQHVFIQLVCPGEGTEDTRRVATRSEVGEDNWDLVTQLADARLVVTGSRTAEKNSTPNPPPGSDSIESEETVEIVHEALIQKWQRIREWMKADRTFRTWQERLRAAMRQWRVSNQDTGALLRGFPLNEAQDWLQKRRTYLPPDEREYIEISWKFHEQDEAERKEKEFEIRTMSEANQKAKRRIKIGSVFLGVSVFLAAMAFIGRDTAIKGLTEAQEGTKLEQAGVSALRQLRSGEIEALLAAMQSGQRLKALIKDGRSPQDYPAASPVLALQKILDTIYEQNRFNSNQGEVKSVSFSPNGRLIATAGKDGTVQLWSLSGQKQGGLEGHEGGVLGGVNSVSFSLNGQLIATAGEDNTVRLWDLSGKQLAQMNGHQSEVNSVSFSPNEQQIASAGRDGTVRLWDLSGREQTKIEAHRGGVNKVVFSPDGEKIATAGQDGVARLWDKSGKKLTEIMGHQGQQVFGISFSPDGKYLATAADDNTARIWNLSGKEQGKLEGHRGWVISVSFSPDGKRLATASDDGTARVWDFSGQEMARLQGHRGVVVSASFSPEGKYVITSGRDGTVRLWNLSPKQTVQFPGFQKDVNAISFSPDRQLIVGAGDEGIARIWNLSGQQQAQWQATPRGAIWAVAFSPDEPLIATAGYENVVRLWGLSGEPKATLKGHKAWVKSISFSSDGQLIATSGADKTARLWNRLGKQVATLKGHKDVVGAVSISPDGQHVATGDWKGTIGMWDRSGKQIKQWQGHQGQIRSLSFSPDGQQLAVADDNSVVRLWDLSGKQRHEFFSYQSGINSLKFSPNGQYIVTGGMDSTVRIWDLQGRQIAEFTNERGAIWEISFSPDAQSLVAGGDNGSVKLWQVKGLEELLVQGCEWLQDYLESHPEAMIFFKECHK
ncbi:trypsin-like peptidase domain-containing protein [Trichocoleus sp. ST-U3]